MTPFFAHMAEPQLETRSTVTATAVRRARYMARFIYWTVRHRSTANVRWVLAFEGYQW